MIKGNVADLRKISKGCRRKYNTKIKYTLMETKRKKMVDGK